MLRHPVPAPDPIHTGTTPVSLPGRTYCPRRCCLLRWPAGQTPFNQGREQHRVTGQAPKMKRQALHPGKTQNPSQGTSHLPPWHNPKGKALTEHWVCEGSSLSPMGLPVSLRPTPNAPAPPLFTNTGTMWEAQRSGEPSPLPSQQASPAGLKAIRFFLPLLTCLKKPSWSSPAAVTRLWGSGSKQDKTKALASAERVSGISG